MIFVLLYQNRPISLINISPMLNIVLHRNNLLTQDKFNKKWIINIRLAINIPLALSIFLSFIPFLTLPFHYTIFFQSNIFSTPRQKISPQKPCKIRLYELWHHRTKPPKRAKRWVLIFLIFHSPWTFKLIIIQKRNLSQGSLIYTILLLHDIPGLPPDGADFSGNMPFIYIIE